MITRPWTIRKHEKSSSRIFHLPSFSSVPSYFSPEYVGAYKAYLTILKLNWIPQSYLKKSLSILSMKRPFKGWRFSPGFHVQKRSYSPTKCLWRFSNKTKPYFGQSSPFSKSKVLLIYIFDTNFTLKTLNFLFTVQNHSNNSLILFSSYSFLTHAGSALFFPPW